MALGCVLEDFCRQVTSDVEDEATERLHIEGEPGVIHDGNKKRDR